MTLKHGTLDAWIARHDRVPDGALRELADLLERSDPAELDRLRASALPTLTAETFEGCLTNLRTKRKGPRAWVPAARMVAALRSYRRAPRSVEIGRNIGRRIARGIRRRLPAGIPRKRPSAGGLLIAVVGGDGAGKTTAIGDLADWLSGPFDVHRCHLGRPPWSLGTRFARGLAKLVVLGARPILGCFGEHGVRGLARMERARGRLWLLCVARDRASTVAKARRAVGNGAIALCDRFPLRELALMDGPMIGQQLGEQADGRGSGARLAALERRPYAAMGRPDLILALRVDPETAVARKTDETPESVRPRSREVWGADWSAADVVVVDAGQRREAVLGELKQQIWRSL